MTQVCPNPIPWNAVSGVHHSLVLDLGVSDGGDQPHRQLPLRPHARGDFFHRNFPEFMGVAGFEKIFEILAVDMSLSPGNSPFSHETTTLR